MSSKKSALLIRMGPYNVTQAVPRAAATLQELGYNITILSLDQTGKKAKDENIDGWQIIRYRHRYKSGNMLSYLWGWNLKSL